MNRLLALSVLACSVLTGCGSSGGSSPASVKKYTFEFVKLDEGEVS